MADEQLRRKIEDKIRGMSEEEKNKFMESIEDSSDGQDPIAELLTPLNDLTSKAPLTKVEEALRSLVSTLNGADPLRYATVREAAIRKLDTVGVNSPARLIDAALQNGQSGKSDQQQGRPVSFDDPEPWLEPMDGSAMLDGIVTTLKRFVIFPPNAVGTVALWILHAHALEAFSISPLLAINSAEKQSGKTTLLDIISHLVPRRLFASSITSSVLFRTVDEHKPSLLIDEADTFIAEHDELRGILNASHCKDTSSVLRSVGDHYETRMFATWCPKAIALIGKLPATLEDRSILVTMKRKGRNEKREKFVADREKDGLRILKRKIMRWVADNFGSLCKADPDTPEELSDRAADNWRSLIAIADLVGGEWPETTRKAAKVLSGLTLEGDNSCGIQLLADLRNLFTEAGKDGTGNLTSVDICSVLGEMEESPWPEWKGGKPITPKQLANLLKPFGVHPGTIRIENTTAKGYEQKDLIDPFARYLPPLDPSQGKQVNENNGLGTNSDPSQGGHVTDEKVGVSTGNKRDVTDVTDRKPPIAEGGGYKEAL